jgi:DNA-binding transcriptional MerR regulator
MSEPELWTQKETAERLRRSVFTLERWRRQGLGPPWVRVGNRPMYRPADVRRWLDEQGQERRG